MPLQENNYLETINSYTLKDWQPLLDLTLVIEATTDFESESGFSTELPCIDKKCKGTTQSRLLIEKDHEIYWCCEKCGEEGIITEWEGTHWDQS